MKFDNFLPFTQYEISRNTFVQLFSKITRSLVRNFNVSCREFRKIEKGIGNVYAGTVYTGMKNGRRTNESRLILLIS